MSRIVYVNGEYLPEEEAKLSVFDRGFLFADAVYEVSSIIDGRLIDNQQHLLRLKRSLDELNMAEPCPMEEIERIQHEVVKRNAVSEGMLYLQVTRGAADRDFNFPADARPSLVMFTQAKKVAENPAAERGLSVITLPDLRWHRRDIKTVQLLYPSMCKEEARARGADDAWLVEDGQVTEGTSNNAWIVLHDGTLVTRQLSTDILHGITRRAVLRFARERQIRVEERPFTVEEAQGAREAFITSASAFVTPVVSIDGKPVGDGRPGDTARGLRGIYLEEAGKL
ncbi:MAG: D-amino-acid transaminase [Nitratireductor sp.]|nr:D-amino-acid transaminase [Nitratireductor sp.]